MEKASIAIRRQFRYNDLFYDSHTIKSMNNNLADEIFLSVVIPAYNEDGRIANTLVKIRNYLDRQNYSSEIIVVSDGCTDSTDLCATESMKNWPNFRLLSRVENIGKGYSVREGILHSR